MNLRELVEKQSNKDPDKIFLYFGEQEVTHKRFNENINRVANVSLDLGIN